MVGIAAMLVTNASSVTPGNSAHEASHADHGATESEISDFAASLRDASKPLISKFSAEAVSAATESLAATQ